MSYGLAPTEHIFRIVCSENRLFLCFQEVWDQSASLRDKKKGTEAEGGPGVCPMVSLPPYCCPVFMCPLAPELRLPFPPLPILEAPENALHPVDKGKVNVC